jgi:hypothetical protein
MVACRYENAREFKDLAYVCQSMDVVGIKIFLFIRREADLHRFSFERHPICAVCGLFPTLSNEDNYNNVEMQSSSGF